MKGKILKHHSLTKEACSSFVETFWLFFGIFVSYRLNLDTAAILIRQRQFVPFPSKNAEITSKRAIAN